MLSVSYENAATEVHSNVLQREVKCQF